MMLITFSMIQVAMGRRCGPLVALADLNDAAFYALSTLNLPAGNPTALLDADFAGVTTAAQVAQLWDVTELRMLQMIYNNLTAEELRKGGVFSDCEEIRRLLSDRIEKLAAFAKSVYGVGLGTLQVGTVDFNFQQQDTAASIDF